VIMGTLKTRVWEGHRSSGLILLHPF
jgi:hypothetical protein